jgi:hypothetical protein
MPEQKDHGSLHERLNAIRDQNQPFQGANSLKLLEIT